MKLPNSPIVQAVAKNLGIHTRGKLLQCLRLMNPNASLLYYMNDEMEHIRVRQLLKNEFLTEEEYKVYCKNQYKQKKHQVCR